jgi:hypothetical protein
VIIDESFWPSTIKQASFGFDRLNSFAKRRDYVGTIARVIQNAMVNGESLKKTLKNIGVTKSELQDAAKSASADIETPPITPRMDIKTQRILVRKAKSRKGVNFRRMWGLMAEEIDLPGDEFRRVQFKRDVPVPNGEKQDRIFINWCNQLRVVRNHVLVLDADANEEILKRFLPHIEVSAIDVERNAEVIQVMDTPCSKRRLLGAKPEETDTAARRLADVQTLIDQEARGGRSVLVVATKKVAEHLTELDGCEITWFGALLGVNRFKDIHTVIIVGREQAPPDVYEEQARAFWWDKELEFIDIDEYGNRMLSKEKRAYRMRDGSIRSVEVGVHPDPRIQMLVEQGREAQSAQAIDRLRLIHNVRAKRVLILSNIPLDVTVDKLVTWREMVPSRIDRAINQNDVLPTSHGELARIFPELWPTPAAAKEQLKRQGLNGNDLLVIYILGKRSYLILVNYRRPGQRGNATKALISLAISNPRAALEAVVGEVVHFEFEKICSSRGEIAVHIEEGKGPEPSAPPLFGGIISILVDRVRNFPDDARIFTE